MSNAPTNFRDVQTRFAGHIRDPEQTPAPDDVSDRRMAIYRELFFNNIESFFASNFPVAKKTLGPDSWKPLVRQFMVKHRASTPYFPELPREFLRFLQAHPQAYTDQWPWLLELAHYEWLELAVTVDTEDAQHVECEEDGDLLSGNPVVNPVIRVMAYNWPVHEIGPDNIPSAPLEQPVHLAVWRKLDDKVGFVALNAMSARLLTMMQENSGRTGLDYLTDLATQAGMSLDALRGHGLDLMEGWRQREIILGTNHS